MLAEVEKLKWPRNKPAVLYTVSCVKSCKLSFAFCLLKSCPSVVIATMPCVANKYLSVFMLSVCLPEVLIITNMAKSLERT